MGGGGGKGGLACIMSVFSSPSHTLPFAVALRPRSTPPPPNHFHVPTPLY